MGATVGFNLLSTYGSVGYAPLQSAALAREGGSWPAQRRRRDAVATNAWSTPLSTAASSASPPPPTLPRFDARGARSLLSRGSAQCGARTLGSVPRTNRLRLRTVGLPLRRAPAIERSQLLTYPNPDTVQQYHGTFVERRRTIPNPSAISACRHKTSTVHGSYCFMDVIRMLCLSILHTVAALHI